MKKIYVVILFCLIGINCVHNKKPETSPLPAEHLKIEAVFMRYACGDWNDDMQVTSVNDTVFNFLLEKDIDPEFLNGEKQISGWLYDNSTIELGYKYKLTGTVDPNAKYGCGAEACKFIITKIERLDGSIFDTTGVN